MRGFLLVLFLFPIILPAQDMTYVRQVVDTLTAPGMHGRGYVNEGDKIAANYIAQEFRKLGLDSFGPGYFQHFSFPVNTFPGGMTVTVNDKLLVPGADYIVNPASKGGKGTFSFTEVSVPPSKTDQKKLSGRFLLVDKSKTSTTGAADSLNEWKKTENAAGALFIEENKLTWSVATQQLSMPVIHVLRKAMPEKCSKISIQIDAKLNSKHETQNVLGYIRGNTEPDSFIVISAHYDHLGRMGREIYFPGANDNASGIGMLLSLAAYYATSGNNPGCSMVFIAFAGEEAGLIGSEYYTKNPLFPLSAIKFVLNMDLLGTGDDGMMVVNGDVFKDHFELLGKINDKNQYVKTLGKRGKARNSDHYYFSENGVPSFFFYTLGGTTFYHDIFDKAETLPYTDFTDVFRLTRDFITELSGQ